MNELLGWYGYDKVELRDSEASEIRNYRERRQHVSVLKGKGPHAPQPQVRPAGKAQVSTVGRGRPRLRNTGPAGSHALRCVTVG